MTQILSELPQGARVAIIRLRSLGDCVLTTPAISLLHAHRPDLKIAVVVEPRFAEIFDGNPKLDAILPQSALAIARFRPCLSLNLHGGTRSMLLTGASLARYRAGFAHHRLSSIYNVPIPTAQEILGVDRKVHTAEHLASAIFYLGARRSPIPPAELYADRSPAFPKPYVVLHPFAAQPEKAWPADRFLRLAHHLQQQHGLEPVVIGGPHDDASLFHQFRSFTGGTLSQTKSVLAGASLFIGNDSGPAHMAAAFGIPVIVLFGPSDPVIWAPWQVESEIVTSGGSAASIPLDRVLEAVDHLRVSR